MLAGKGVHPSHPSEVSHNQAPRAYAKGAFVVRECVSSERTFGRASIQVVLGLSTLGLPAALARSLSGTNITESPQSLIARFRGRVKHGQDPRMVMRWHARPA